MIYYSTCKGIFEIMYGKLLKSDIFTKDKVQKYISNWGSFAKSESLTKRICAKQGEDIK